jgi:glycosyltransferase involved in cell wall biosynthesis
MSNVGIIHSTLNPCGGSELVALHTIKALKEEGIRTCLFTFDKTDWTRVINLTNIDVRPDKEVVLMKTRLPLFGLYQRFLSGVPLLIHRRNLDLIINTHGDIIPFSSDITYIHFPTTAYLYTEYSEYSKYDKNLFWKIYFQPYRLLASSVGDRWIRDTIILTNSSYSSMAIKKILGRGSIVIYPPVAISEYLEAGVKSIKRENLVVSIARYAEEKNIDRLIDIAMKTKSARFIHIGVSYNPISEAYYHRLKKRAQREGALNISFLKNISHVDKLKILSRASVYLHPPFAEHFGISIVEAMASGLVPVVPRDGGVWTDIVYRGRYGFGYRNADEAGKIISEIISNEEIYIEYRELALVRSKKFSDDFFRKRISKVIRCFL